MNFSMTRLSDDGGRSGAIVFEGASVQETVEFLSLLVECMFPPGERAVTNLEVQSGASGFLMLEADCTAGRAEIRVPDVEGGTARFVRSSIELRGSILFLFAGTEGGTRTFLKPSANHLARAEALVDGDRVVGTGMWDWKPLLAHVEEEYPWIAVTG